jgi:hypothetical protein
MRPVLASTAITDQVAEAARGVIARIMATPKIFINFERRLKFSMLRIPYSVNSNSKLFGLMKSLVF